MSDEVHDARFTSSLLACQDDLYAYLFSLTLNVDAAEELLQQTNLVVCKKSSEALAAPNFRAWVFKAAHLEALAFRRRDRRQRPLSLDNALDFLARETPPDDGTSIRSSALAFCLEKLSRQNRELILRRHQPGNSVHQLAVEMNRSAAVVSNMLYRIRQRLLACVQRRVSEETAQ